MAAGRRPDVSPRERLFGSRRADADPVALKMPAYGAAIPPKASQGRGRGCLECLQLWLAAGGGRGADAAAAVDVDQAGELVGPGMPTEVPGGIGGDDRATE